MIVDFNTNAFEVAIILNVPFNEVDGWKGSPLKSLYGKKLSDDFINCLCRHIDTNQVKYEKMSHAKHAKYTVIAGANKVREYSGGDFIIYYDNYLHFFSKQMMQFLGLLTLGDSRIFDNEVNDLLKPT